MAIRMTPSELRDLATAVSGIGEEISSQVETMNSRIEADTAEWDGESKSQYFTDYDEIIPVLQKDFPAVIANLAEKLNFAANKLEEADQDIAAAIRN